MPALTAVTRTAEGFLERAADWDPDLAVELAAEAGVGPLTDRHWLVLDYMRNTFLVKGDGPTIRTLGKESGVEIKELYKLFPRGPAKIAAKIAGIPKPHGCI